MELPLFEDWKDFVTLLPEERIINVYKDVDFGDLILTNKRLIHLKYKCEYKYRKKIAFMYKYVSRITLLSLLLYPFLFLLLFLSFLFLLLPLLLFVFTLILATRRVEKYWPIGYKQVSFEVPLEKIEVESSEDSLRIRYRRRPIFIRFNDVSHMYEFKKTLSYLVYEVQHRPKETVQYNIVVKFNIDKDGTISVQCPHCGASAPLRTKESEVTCKYCGKQYIIPKKLLDLI
ncbi:MAG: hypothetical protein FGF48_07305 [Candidatus Brockarchaeota archaeon]|nr:hypothetical protein [Candidatus Brockarchaeota archaeon]